MKKLLTVLLLSYLTGAHARAEDIPQGSVVDERVKTLLFSENQVYKLVAFYGFQIDLELASNEDIKTVAAGDSIGWQIVTAGQHVFIKPMARDARTNLSIITSKRTYIFDLSSRSAMDRDTITYFVKFKYPDTQWSGTVASAKGKSAHDFNFNYTLSGAPEAKPMRVFDDGEFTFFEFANSQDLPAIFIEGGDGKESLVNFRMEGAYVVVERLGDFFTLRNGKRTATVMSSKLMQEPV